MYFYHWICASCAGNRSTSALFATVGTYLTHIARVGIISWVAGLLANSSLKFVCADTRPAFSWLVGCWTSSTRWITSRWCDAYVSGAARWIRLVAICCIASYACVSIQAIQASCDASSTLVVLRIVVEIRTFIIAGVAEKIFHPFTARTFRHICQTSSAWNLTKSTRTSN